MGAQAAYERIAADMRTLWGVMALPMLRKRLRDVHADPNALTREDLERIVVLLRAKTLPALLGAEGAEATARRYIGGVADSG